MKIKTPKKRILTTEQKLKKSKYMKKFRTLTTPEHRQKLRDYMKAYRKKNLSSMNEKQRAYREMLPKRKAFRQKILDALYARLPSDEIHALKEEYFELFKKRFESCYDYTNPDTNTRISKALIDQYERLFGVEFIYSDSTETDADVQKIIDAKIQEDLELEKKNSLKNRLEIRRKKANHTIIQKVVPFIPSKPFTVGDHVLLIEDHSTHTEVIMEGCVLSIDDFLEHLYPYSVRILLSDRKQIDVTRDGMVYYQDYHSEKTIYKQAGVNDIITKQHRKNSY